MNYLADTNVLSGLRNRAKANAGVIAWEKSVDASSVFLSVVSILELETGTQLMERRDPRQGALLREWLEGRVLPSFEGRILPIDQQIAMRCAGLHVPHPRSYRDALIAATALVHSMTVVTRDVKDFKSIGVLLVNPWQESND